MASPLPRTMFATPVVRPLLRGASMLLLKLRGWTWRGSLPPGVKRCVMIAAPHTSNWDLPYMLMVSFALGIDVHWMGKDTIFRAPVGGLMKWMGGIPVDRSKHHDLVASSAQRLKDADSLILVVPPEGTRRRVTAWKTGFYWIAHGAHVPILLGYLDYAKKEGGIARAFTPTGDLEKDLAEIKAFYATVTGRKPQNFALSG